MNQRVIDQIDSYVIQGSHSIELTNEYIDLIDRINDGSDDLKGLKVRLIALKDKDGFKPNFMGSTCKGY
jgi:hypothetical protein